MTSSYLCDLPKRIIEFLRALNNLLQILFKFLLVKFLFRKDIPELRTVFP